MECLLTRQASAGQSGVQAYLVSVLSLSVTSCGSGDLLVSVSKVEKKCPSFVVTVKGSKIMHIIISPAWPCHPHSD